MTTTLCVLLLHGCFIRIAIDWISQQDLVHAREALAKTLGAEFLYGEDQP